MRHLTRSGKTKLVAAPDTGTSRTRQRDKQSTGGVTSNGSGFCWSTLTVPPPLLLLLQSHNHQTHVTFRRSQVEWVREINTFSLPKSKWNQYVGTSHETQARTITTKRTHSMFKASNPIRPHLLHYRSNILQLQRAELVLLQKVVEILLKHFKHKTGVILVLEALKGANEVKLVRVLRRQPI